MKKLLTQKLQQLIDDLPKGVEKAIVIDDYLRLKVSGDLDEIDDMKCKYFLDEQKIRND